MKVELEIHPSFIESCYIILKNNYISINIKTPHEAIEHTENIVDLTWSFEDIDNNLFASITELTDKIIKVSKKDDRLILDGVSLICKMQKDSTTTQYNFKCPEPNTSELELILNYFSLINNLDIDNNLNNYLELLEGYFIDRLPFKEFNEDPHRLRIYGSLSIYEKKGLEDKIVEVAKKNNLIVDMTNFQTMGYVLHECFSPLKNVKNLKFWVNDSSMEHLTKAGFEKSQMKLN